MNILCFKLVKDCFMFLNVGFDGRSGGATNGLFAAIFKFYIQNTARYTRIVSIL